MKKELKEIGSLTIVCLILFSTTGCTDAQRAKIGGLGNPHHVEMYSGGQLVRQWVASGKVESEQNSDGYYFNDYKTGKLIEVAGDVVISMLQDQKEAEVVASSF